MLQWVDAPLVDTSPLIDLHLPELMAMTLVRRGFTSQASVQSFLNPSEYPITPFPDSESIASQLISYINKKERICVWGDFDVDGQTSTALLVQTLQLLGANVLSYIPIRGKEGHGLHLGSLKSLLDGGVKLLLTCDTGITANEAVDYARARGVDVIITDHHLPGQSLPQANGIMNPALLSKDHPLSTLSGVGVAYKLAELILAGERNILLEKLLDLVALGLIADVARLKGETRSLAQKGIKALRSTTRLGLITIAEMAGVNLSNATEEMIGFSIAPRLNALGRLSDANPAVELLITSNAARARVLATQIENLNIQRRLLTGQVYQAAQSQLKMDPDLLEQPAILLHHPQWPGGVLGIVASKLVERYQKPVLLMNLSDQGVLSGSARSVGNVHITEAIQACEEYLLSFGGHPMAAGLSLEAKKLSEFQKTFQKSIGESLAETQLEEPQLQIDAWLKLSDLSLELANSLEELAPFGAGNPSLILATRRLELVSAKKIGKTDEHIKLVVKDKDQIQQEIMWWGGAEEELPEGQFDLAYKIRPSNYRADQSLSIEFQAYRSIVKQSVEIPVRKYEISDLRNKPEDFDGLKIGRLTWAEGLDKQKGKARHELVQADEFVIWTSPSSPAAMREAMKIVKPRKIYIFAVPPNKRTTEEFLTQLAGLAKFALNTKSGEISLRGIAAETAQREVTVRLGLSWLEAGGHLKVNEEHEKLTLSSGTKVSDPYLQKELFISVSGSQNETEAYRRLIATAPIESLFNFL